MTIRTRSRGLLGSAVVAASVLLAAGCGGTGGTPASGSTSTGAPSSTGSPSRTSAAPAALTLHVGQCLNDQPHWQTQPCDAPHFYEVAAVVPSTRYAGDPAKRAAYSNSVCDERGGAYLDGPPYGSLLLSTPLPRDADPQARKQIVCLISHSKPDDSGIVADTHSLKGALAGSGFDRYRLCLADKASGHDVQVSSCDRPHVSEATWGFIVGSWGEKYPGEKAINKTSLKTCEPKDRAFIGGVDRSDISFAQNSSGKSAWSHGHRLTVCFVQVNHGKVTGTMKNIKHKPLSSIR